MYYIDESVLCFILCHRYGGFSLGGSTTQASPQIHHVQDSVKAIRARYRVPQVPTRFDAWSSAVIWGFLNVLSFFLLFFNSSQNSSLDALLQRLPSFLERLNSQNNVKVRAFMFQDP